MFMLHPGNDDRKWSPGADDQPSVVMFGTVRRVTSEKLSILLQGWQMAGAAFMPSGCWEYYQLAPALHA